MKIACMQPYILPALQYFQLIYSCDNFVFLDDVKFINKGFVHRNYVINKKEKEQITLKIKKKSQNKQINELEILDDNNLILKKIFFLYKKSKNFKIIFPIIEEALCSDLKYLDKINSEIIIKISRLLGIDTKFEFSSLIDPKPQNGGEIRIIEIVKKLKGKIYINPIGGKKLYKKENFLKNKIDLKFLNSQIDYECQYENLFKKTEISILHFLMKIDLNIFSKELKKFKLVSY